MVLFINVFKDQKVLVVVPKVLTVQSLYLSLAELTVFDVPFVIAFNVA